MTGFLIALAVLSLVLWGLFALFRLWARHARPEVPGTVTLGIGLLGAISSLILGSPPPRPRGTTAGEQVMIGVVGRVADGIATVAMMTGLALTVMVCTAMALGIRAGLRNRPPGKGERT